MSVLLAFSWCFPVVMGIFHPVCMPSYFCLLLISAVVQENKSLKMSFEGLLV